MAFTTRSSIAAVFDHRQSAFEPQQRQQRADLVIITYKDFAQSIQPLVALRQSQGYHVIVVDVEDIYNEFSYGVHHRMP